MNKPKHFNKGDKIAIVSLSSGILGEQFCAHQLDRGIERLKKFGLQPVLMNNTLKGVDYLKENPKARAEDLKQAFFDDEIKGILCAIGGEDTFKLIPFLMDDSDFIKKVKDTPKIFSGFSDTTNNHLLFYKIGMVSFYGLNFLSDLAELEQDMLPFTKKSFEQLFKNDETFEILSSSFWYEERDDYSNKAINTNRIKHSEIIGYDVLYGTGEVKGRLLGGCLESLFDAYTGSRYPEQKEIYEKYHIMPDLQDWKNKILFFETSQETPAPNLFEKYVSELDKQGILSSVSAVLIGKPLNEKYYDEYREIMLKYAHQYQLPIVYNVNFGHACPRTIIPYGLEVKIDFDKKTIVLTEPLFR